MAKPLLDHTMADTSEREISKLVINMRKIPSGKRVRVLCFEIDKPVSLRQHRYWRLICRYVERETGNDAKDFHDEMKKKFAVQMITVNNKTFEHIPSMASMSMSEAADFITKGIQFIEETFGIECPRPDNVPPEFITRYGGHASDFY
jgi:hypothetical protein